MKVKTTYIASYGEEFSTEEECKAHERGKTPDKIVHKTYLHSEKWKVFEELKEEGYVFDEAIHGNLKYALNEVEVTIEVDTKTGEVTILSFN